MKHNPFHQMVYYDDKAMDAALDKVKKTSEDEIWSVDILIVEKLLIISFYEKSSWAKTLLGGYREL